MHRLILRVYYEDTDLGGVVYYANYLRFLERGRTELLRSAGVDQSMLHAEPGGIIFAVRRMSIEYLKPAHMDDLLRIETATSAGRPVCRPSSCTARAARFVTSAGTWAAPSPVTSTVRASARSTTTSS